MAEIIDLAQRRRALMVFDGALPQVADLEVAKEDKRIGRRYCQDFMLRKFGRVTEVRRNPETGLVQGKFWPDREPGGPQPQYIWRAANVLTPAAGLGPREGGAA